MPGTSFRPSLPMALRAFFSPREWTATEAPAGLLGSSPASEPDSEELSSTGLETSSSWISSTRGAAIFADVLLNKIKNSISGWIFADGRQGGKGGKAGIVGESTPTNRTTSGKRRDLMMERRGFGRVE